MSGQRAYRFFCCLIASGALLFVSPAFSAEPELALDLTLSASVGAGQVGVALTAGIDPAADTGFDPGTDTQAFRMGALQAWFFHPDATPDPARYLRRDFRSGAVEEVWIIQVGTTVSGPVGAVAEGSPVIIHWDPPVSGGGVCAERSLQMVDASAGTAYDMTQVNNLTIPAPTPGTPYTLELTIGTAGSESEMPPAPPERLFSPHAGRRGVLLVWSPAPGDMGVYHVERNDNPGDPESQFNRLTDRPLDASRWLDESAAGLGTVAYRVIAVSASGCESLPSAELIVIP